MATATPKRLPLALSATSRARDRPSHSRNPFATKHAAAAAPASANVRILHGHVVDVIKGKIELGSNEQYFVDVTETTANVEYITACVKSKWGNDHILVTKNGLPLPDSAGTTGLFTINVIAS